MKKKRGEDMNTLKKKEERESKQHQKKIKNRDPGEKKRQQ